MLDVMLPHFHSVGLCQSFKRLSFRRNDKSTKRTAGGGGGGGGAVRGDKRGKGRGDGG